MPGVALGIVSNGVVSIRGLGITNVEDPLPVTAHTVFPIASISKTFAATAIMRLVEQGKIDLRAPVRTYLPDFRVRDEAVSRDVTVWHLLTHLGGWEGQVSGPDRGTETLKNFVASTTVTDLMQVAPPGAAWSYNNAGFSIAGRVIEAVTGTPINRAIRDLVFQPLGLEHAGTTAGEFIVQRFASGHSTRNGTATLQRPFVPSSSVTAGGVGLCITDLLAYARFHMGDGTAANGERVLKRETLELMRTPQNIKQSTDDVDRYRLAPAAHGRNPHRGAWRHVGRTHSAARARAGTQFRDRHSHELECRMAADSGRRTRSAEVLPRRDVRASIRRSRTAGWSRRCRRCSRIEPSTGSRAVRRHVSRGRAIRLSCALMETRCSCRNVRTTVSRPPRCPSRSLARTARS